MGDPMDTLPSLEPLDLHTIRSRIRELADLHISCGDDVPQLTPSDSEKLLNDCALHLQSRVKQIVSECSDVGSLGVEDLDAYLERLKEELNTVEAESTKISNEIEVLARTHVEDSCLLGTDLEGLECALDFIASQGLEKEKVGGHVDCPVYGEDQSNLKNAQGDCNLEGLEKEKVGGHVDCPVYGEDQSNLKNAQGDCNLELLELEDQIEKRKTTLKSLQDLDGIYKWFDATEQIEDMLTGLKVIAFNENCIRLSLRTYIPKLEGLLNPGEIEDVIEPSELNHELLIEVLEGTMELKNVEIFPNDVYLIDILDAAKSFSKSSLQWFVAQVQDRITLCTLRRLVVKTAKKSRHSFEYLDRDETIVGHMVGGVDAFIKLSQGWPVLSSPLKLISLKSSDHSKGISLSFLCKVEEAANSLDVHIRHNISSFLDAIEKVLVEQMRSELHSDDTLEK